MVKPWVQPHRRCLNLGKSKMINTGSVYDKHVHPGLKVLVMRHWPRGIRREQIDLWLRDLAPSKELLTAYRNKQVDWPEFEKRYRAEMAQNPEALRKAKQLEMQHGTITLLCWEPEGKPCHRFPLQQMLEEMSAS